MQVVYKAAIVDVEELEVWCIFNKEYNLHLKAPNVTEGPIPVKYTGVSGFRLRLRKLMEAERVEKMDSHCRFTLRNVLIFVELWCNPLAEERL